MTARTRQGVYEVEGITPKVADDVFIAPGAIVAGDVVIGAGSSIWFNAVLRGDVAPIRVGERSNVQDGAVLHVDPDAPCIIGNEVTIGHSAVVHGSTVEDGVTIGMGAIVLSRSRIGAGSMIAAGAVVSEDTVVPPCVLMMGIPAKERRAVDDQLRARLDYGTNRYVQNGKLFRETLKLVEREERGDGS